MTRPAIETRGLCKRFGPILALDHVDLKVAPGERIALLGHNGAGKTTLIKTILGLIEPTAGHVNVAGGRPGSLPVRRQCAFLPENLETFESPIIPFEPIKALRGGEAK